MSFWTRVQDSLPPTKDDGACRLTSVRVFVRTRGEIDVATLVKHDDEDPAQWVNGAGFSINPDEWAYAPE